MVRPGFVAPELLRQNCTPGRALLRPQGVKAHDFAFSESSQHSLGSLVDALQHAPVGLQTMLAAPGRKRRLPRATAHNKEPPAACAGGGCVGPPTISGWPRWQEWMRVRRPAAARIRASPACAGCPLRPQSLRCCLHPACARCKPACRHPPAARSVAIDCWRRKQGHHRDRHGAPRPVRPAARSCIRRASSSSMLSRVSDGAAMQVAASKPVSHGAACRQAIWPGAGS